MMNTDGLIVRIITKIAKPYKAREAAEKDNKETFALDSRRHRGDEIERDFADDDSY